MLSRVCAKNALVPGLAKWLWHVQLTENKGLCHVPGLKGDTYVFSLLYTYVSPFTAGTWHFSMFSISWTCQSHFARPGTSAFLAQTYLRGYVIPGQLRPGLSATQLSTCWVCLACLPGNRQRLAAGWRAERKGEKNQHEAKTKSNTPDPLALHQGDSPTGNSRHRSDCAGNSFRAGG